MAKKGRLTPTTVKLSKNIYRTFNRLIMPIGTKKVFANALPEALKHLFSR